MDKPNKSPKCLNKSNTRKYLIINS